jgi:hypothetical protein
MTEEVRFLPLSYWTEKASDKLRNDYYSGAADISITITLFWGVKSVSTSDSDMWDPEDLGIMKWDKDFDITQTAS